MFWLTRLGNLYKKKTLCVYFWMSYFTDKMECEKNPCENGGTCYEQDKCFCLSDYYGERCQYKTGTLNKNE